MTGWHAPLLTPSMGFYALVAVLVICALGWILSRAQQRAEDDPIAAEFEREEWR